MSFGDFGPFGDYRYPPGTGYLPGESSKEVARENFVQDWLYSDEYDYGATASRLIRTILIQFCSEKNTPPNYLKTNTKIED